MPKDSIDILWVVLCAGLVFNMQIGFLCLEAGLTRSKNAINVATKNMADLCIALLLYWLFGFALMFGTSQDGLMGSGLFMLDFAIDDSWPMAFFLFQAMFCTTAATIVSGAAAERMRFNAYLIVAALSAGLIYPLFGHWAWGGALREGQGWLAQQGFVDFAGSTVVHGVGGWIALATVMVIGPRAGRFDTKWLRQNMPGSNLPLAMLGGLLLLFGWFGFNGGSTLSFDGRVPGIIVNTVVAGMAGMALSMLLSQWRHGYIAPVALLNGMLAGLVAITASAHAVGIADSLLIGAGGGLAMWLSDRLLVRCGIDDAVGAVPVHLAAGLWGTVAVPLFADPLLLGTGLGRLDQLMVQLQGVLVCAVWAFGVTYLLLRVINRYYPMRVDPDEERVGLNVSEHGARTELIELLDAMAEHQRQGQFQREVEVEPFTEVGQIAEQYNKVIRALEDAVAKTQTIVRDIRDGIVTYGRDGILTSCNPGAERLFGLPAEQIIGQPFQRFVLGSNASLLPEAGGEMKAEMMLHGKDGELFAAELTASQGGRPDDAFVCMVRDITERRQVEEQLFAEKMLAQVTLASIGDGVITTDRLGRVRYLNPSAERLIGWSQAAAQGLVLDEVYQLFDEATGARLPNAASLGLRRRSDRQDRTERPPGFLQRPDGTRLAVQDAVAPIRDAEGVIIGAVLTFRDVTVTHQLARKLTFQANHDNLTGLMNRSAFERRIESLLREYSGGENVLCYMDLDQFKVVNDTCGHAAGDELLRQLGQLLKGRVRGSDLLARLGGDEFGILFNDCSLQQAVRIAEDIRHAVDEFRFSWDGKSFAVGASIGLVAIDEHVKTLGPLLGAADSACYAAKDGGRNRVHVYQADDQQLMERRGEMQWTQRLRQALDGDLLRLFVQPIVRAAGDDGSQRYEVLVRMQGEDGSIIPPGAFMPAAERYDLAPAVDRWVVGNFLAWVGDLRRRPGATLGHYSINLSATSLGEESFLEFVLSAIERHRIPPNCLCFEITETAAIANLSRAMTFMKGLKAVGCSFALDDFGSGLSSFGYLKTLPVDYLKIDGSFVRDIDQDPIARAMVASINNIGHEMGLSTVAEFVESAAILECLQEIGVDYVQGYHLGRPGPLSELSGVRMMPR
ncbi:ammonium transporter [Stutzerimonas xanthomarina]|uniref:ammonium transporter n=1 Tax=Stutzerimonas xanthomarina TaxID=271420 RepID=UPI0029AFA81F|nr:ammonium transporter [Stutzerimonas xanthomarina]MDX2350924.1 ammonium transporter [Stutzerimonas xanthomarina]